MNRTVLPGIKENVVSDFYLTPDYFEIDQQLFMGLDFQFSQNFLSRLILDFIINLKYIKTYTLLVREHIQVLECQEFFSKSFDKLF